MELVHLKSVLPLSVSLLRQPQSLGDHVGSGYMKFKNPAKINHLKEQRLAYRQISSSNPSAMQ